MAERHEVIDQFFGDASTPVEWASEEEKRLHFWFDDLHCPEPISPMWFDIGGWWYTCAYMYRRFGVPFGRDWVAKNVGGYVFTAVVPREEPEAKELEAYYQMVTPVYAEKFLRWWKHRYLPEIRRNFEYLDTYPTEEASLAELMVLLEDALDIQERHFRLHWILNLAQFQSALDFQTLFKELVGESHTALVGRILVSDEDRNWDSIRELWTLKETVKGSDVLRRAVSAASVDDVLRALGESEQGRELLRALDAYKLEYGNKSIYTHEYIVPTWREDPTPIIEGLRGYLHSDYDYPAEVAALRKNRDDAIAEMWSLVPADRAEEDRQRLQKALDLALGMTPLTPDHHFYMDQGTYARVRLVFMAIGRRLVDAGVMLQPDDVFFLTYHELRLVSASSTAFDAKARVQARRRAREEAIGKRPRAWLGTITNWSLHSEPYKGHWGWPDVYTRAATQAAQPSGTLQGLGASPGVVEGVARIVESPEEFNQVREGDILVCKMTNPAWVLLFTKISGLVTDAGGVLSHPAIVSREFNIPAVVGTGVATEQITTGQRLRVNGTTGIVELLDTPVAAAVQA
ncbi:MAG: PEP-utilizing protein mobile subunit [Luteitalea sp.]|nr:PEP-utilizing protein mobile subunit [Luteitalea sp.]